MDKQENSTVKGKIIKLEVTGNEKINSGSSLCCFGM